jgi:hypothetical protein
MPLITGVLNEINFEDGYKKNANCFKNRESRVPKKKRRSFFKTVCVSLAFFSEAQFKLKVPGGTHPCNRLWFWFVSHSLGNRVETDPASTGCCWVVTM